jgi:hypothetical protein
VQRRPTVLDQAGAVDPVLVARRRPVGEVGDAARAESAGCTPFRSA